MKNLVITLSLMGAACAPQLTYAQGGVQGGGGDVSEFRVDDIREDILKWVVRGGAKALLFRKETTLEAYEKKMTEILQAQTVVIGFTEDQSQVQVDGQAKACKGYLDPKDQKPHILCSIERFKAASEDEQYRLVHHEYAGLTGVESNVGAASDYFFSNQLSGFLETKLIKRLVIKANNETANPVDYQKDAVSRSFTRDQIRVFKCIKEVLGRAQIVDPGSKQKTSEEWLENFFGMLSPHDQLSQSWQELNFLKNDCEKHAARAIYLKSFVSPDLAVTPRQLALIKTLLPNPDADVSCKGHIINLNLSVLYGVSGGVTGVICEAKNGTRWIQAGTRFGTNFGLGATLGWERETNTQSQNAPRLEAHKERIREKNDVITYALGVGRTKDLLYLGCSQSPSGYERNAYAAGFGFSNQYGSYVVRGKVISLPTRWSKVFSPYFN